MEILKQIWGKTGAPFFEEVLPVKWPSFCSCFNVLTHWDVVMHTVYPKKYAHGFCFAVLCCGYTLTDFPISIRLTSLALWQSNDCPSASKATLMNMDNYFMWIHYERLHNHNKAKHNKTVCIFLGTYCMCQWTESSLVQAMSVWHQAITWINSGLLIIAILEQISVKFESK